MSENLLFETENQLFETENQLLETVDRKHFFFGHFTYFFHEQSLLTPNE